MASSHVALTHALHAMACMSAHTRTHSRCCNSACAHVLSLDMQIACDGGRLCRPLILCNDGAPRLTEEHVQVRLLQHWMPACRALRVACTDCIPKPTAAAAALLQHLMQWSCAHQSHAEQRSVCWLLSGSIGSNPSMHLCTPVSCMPYLCTPAGRQSRPRALSRPCEAWRPRVP